MSFIQAFNPVNTARVDAQVVKMNEKFTLMGKAKAVNNSVAKFFAVVGVALLYVATLGIMGVVDLARSASRGDAKAELMSNFKKNIAIGTAVTAGVAGISSVAAYFLSGSAPATETPAFDLLGQCPAVKLQDGDIIDGGFVINGGALEYDANASFLANISNSFI